MNFMACLHTALLRRVKIHRVITLVLLFVSNLCASQDLTPEAGGSRPASTFAGQSNAIIPGQLIHRVDPQYPKRARKKKLEGQVLLQATIERDGSVGNVSVLSGEVILAESAIDAVREWRFEPYTQNGLPVEVLQNLTFTFARDKKIGALDPSLPAPVATPEMNALASGTKKASAFRVGNGVSAPKALFAPDPAYDKEARKAKYQGTCVLSLIVGTDGLPRDIKVTRGIGKGLDEKAVEAVSKWKFEPAKKDGKPVAVFINVEIAFRLY